MENSIKIDFNDIMSSNIASSLNIGIDGLELLCTTRFFSSVTSFIQSILPVLFSNNSDMINGAESLFNLDINFTR